MNKNGSYGDLQQFRIQLSHWLIPCEDLLETYCFVFIGADGAVLSCGDGLDEFVGSFFVDRLVSHNRIQLSLQFLYIRRIHGFDIWSFDTCRILNHSVE